LKDNDVVIIKMGIKALSEGRCEVDVCPETIRELGLETRAKREQPICGSLDFTDGQRASFANQEPDLLADHNRGAILLCGPRPDRYGTTATD
jgi:hypothetical protein